MKKSLMATAKNISAASLEHRLTGTVSVSCLVGQKTLRVWVNYKIGSERVWCDTGCTSSHMKFIPKISNT